MLVPDSVATRSDSVQLTHVLSKLRQDPVPVKLWRYIDPSNVIDEAERAMRSTEEDRFLDLFRDSWRCFAELPDAFPSLVTGQQAVDTIRSLMLRLQLPNQLLVFSAVDATCSTRSTVDTITGATSGLDTPSTPYDGVCIHSSVGSP